MENILNITLQTLTDVKYNVTVKPTDTVKELKMKLYETTEIRNAVRILLNKTELDGNKSLQNQGIENFQILQMLLIPPKDITISVNVFKKGSVSVKISDNALVSDLRNSLKDQKHSLGTAPRIYDLFWNGELLEDEKSFHVLGIVNGSILDLKSLSASFRITLVDALCYGLGGVMEVKGTDTVSKVKSKIIERVNEDEYRSVRDGDLVLYYHPLNDPVTFDEMDCDALTMSHYGVEPYDELIFIKYNNREKGANININYLGTETIVYDVRTDECVLGFQLKIQDQLGVPVIKQKLFIQGFPGIDLPYNFEIEYFHDIRLEHVKDEEVN